MEISRRDIRQALLDCGYGIGDLNDQLVDQIHRDLQKANGYQQHELAGRCGDRFCKRDGENGRISPVVTSAKDALKRFQQWKTALADNQESMVLPLDEACASTPARQVASPRACRRTAVRMADGVTGLINVADLRAMLLREVNAERMQEPPPPTRIVLNPRPGELPYKHDPVQRHLDFKKEWAECPIPGATPHRKLRWRIREQMLSIDIPQLPASAGIVNR